MDKSKIIMYTTIGLMSMILVCVMFMQFKTVQQTDVEEVAFMRETELKEMLAEYRRNYQEVQEEIESTQGKIDEYKKSEESEDETIKLLEEEIKDTNMKLGMTDVQGPGIIIKLENGEKAVTYTELLDLINELVLAGAEEISINDQIIVSMTWLKDVNNFVLIDDERQTSPFTIKVIGDTTKLYSALSIKGGYMDTAEIEHKINVEQSDKITIKKYNGKITLNYANNIEEDK